MKEEIFSKKEILIILMIFAVLAFAFLWYELRPYAARQECLKRAESLIKSGNAQQSFEDAYKNCILKKGLN